MGANIKQTKEFPVFAHGFLRWYIEYFLNQINILF
jgi:hypothetical protein